MNLKNGEVCCTHRRELPSWQAYIWTVMILVFLPIYADCSSATAAKVKGGALTKPRRKAPSRPQRTGEA